jgi:hypothetical protein
VRYICTIYSNDHTFAGKKGFAGGGCQGDAPLAQVVVSGESPRQAAAQAYVECVGRARARMLREKHTAPRSVTAQETNPRAIAASLRKTRRPQGEGYLLDNFLEGWWITVESVLPMPTAPRRPRRVRLPRPLLHHFLRTPLPN